MESTKFWNKNSFPQHFKPKITKLTEDIQRHTPCYKTEHWRIFEIFLNLAFERNDPNLTFKVLKYKNQHPKNSGPRQTQTYWTEAPDEEAGPPWKTTTPCQVQSFSRQITG